MRFILNFFFFGLLFYLIYLFFPDTFQTLVKWANQSYEYLKELFIQLTNKIHSNGRSDTVDHYHALLLPITWILKRGK